MNWFKTIVISIGAFVSSIFGGGYHDTAPVPVASSTQVDIQQTSNIQSQISSTTQSQNTTYSSTKTVTAHFFPINSGSSTQSAGVTTKLDEKSYIATDVTATVSCGSQDCFAQKFSACSPAESTADASFISFHSRIIGPVANGCQVEMNYVKNPNPAWINKVMTCILDNKVDLTTAMQKVMTNIFVDTSTCTGPLADIIRNPSQTRINNLK
jgi:hypothetical protein